MALVSPPQNEWAQMARGERRLDQYVPWKILLMPDPNQLDLEGFLQLQFVLCIILASTKKPPGAKPGGVDSLSVSP